MTGPNLAWPQKLEISHANSLAHKLYAPLYSLYVIWPIYDIGYGICYMLNISVNSHDTVCSIQKSGGSRDLLNLLLHERLVLVQGRIGSQVNLRLC